MRTRILIAVILVAGSGYFFYGRENQKYICEGGNEVAHEITLGPWPADVHPPSNLEEAHETLDNHISNELKYVLACTDISKAEVHFGLALWIRNHWKLYIMGELGAELADLGIRDADDASNVIAWTYIKRLRGTPTSAKEESKAYVD